MTATWPAPLRLAPHTVRLGIGAGGLLVTGLWALSARPDDVAALLPGTLFASAARLTGLLAAYGVVVMLVLMTRIPAVEHGVGADRLARWHAWAGRYVLTLCGAHAVLALLAYATEHDVSLVAAGREFARHPALLAAAAGLVLLLFGASAALATALTLAPTASAPAPVEERDAPSGTNGPHGGAVDGDPAGDPGAAGPDRT
ncbi:ferric reductase-like transmembrane domain-containing protein [Streptomyces xiamenensis]